MSIGIKIPGTLAPGTIQGVITESKYIKGGYITVETIEERDHLLHNTQVVTPGTKIYVQANNTEYVCKRDSEGVSRFEESTEDVITKIETSGFVKEDQLTETAESVAQKTVSDAINKSNVEIDKKFDATNSTIDSISNQVDDLSENVANNYYDKSAIERNYYTREESDANISAKLSGYTSTEDLNRVLDDYASTEELNTSINTVKESVKEYLTYGEF